MSAAMVAEHSLHVDGVRWALWRLYSDGSVRSWHWHSDGSELIGYVLSPAGSPMASRRARMFEVDTSRT